MVETSKTRIETRKIQLVGKRSYSISLPKHWIKEKNLKEQDTVYLHITKNNDIIIQGNKNIPTHKETLVVNIENVPNIIEFLIFCYGKSVNNIRIFSKKFDHITIGKIKKILEYLDGYEITIESPQNIEISFLYDDININIKKIIPRILYLLSIMVESLEKKDHATLNQTEMSIDRLYYLSTKILFECFRSNESRIANNIEHYEDIFYYKDIIKRLENMGDVLYQFKDIQYNKEDLSRLKESVKFCEQIILNKEFDKTDRIDNSLSKIPENTDAGYFLKRVYLLCRDLIESMSAVEYNRKYFSKEKD